MPARPCGRFIGIDLAWGANHSSAVAVLDYDGTSAQAVAAFDRCRTDDEILGAVTPFLADTTVVAIDAPTIVHNVTGRRPAEALLARLFQREEAGPHPTSRGRFPDGVRGERIVHRLGALGFDEDPYLKPKARGRRAIEVYPHPAMVVLFNLKRTLKYKARGGRDDEDRYPELRRYRSYVLSLQYEEPPLAHNDLLRDVFAEDVADLRGGALKRREDLWDAFFCAYIGLYHWYWGAERSAVVGDLETGYIVVPAGAELQQRMAALGTNHWPAPEAGKSEEELRRIRPPRRPPPARGSGALRLRGTAEERRAPAGTRERRGERRRYGKQTGERGAQGRFGKTTSKRGGPKTTRRRGPSGPGR